ncbi:MAG: dethiobiotin synthase [Pseudomonadota bacterium]
MTKGIFITGTDTGCGKTEITLGLMRQLQLSGRIVLGMKPVASGAEETHEGLRNRDALRIQRQGSLALDYEQVNPFAYVPPIAPHLAAERAGQPILLDRIREAFERLAARADWVIVEGVGGWLVPLGRETILPDMVSLLDLPVIMVVGMRLGCLNHALLTAESIANTGLALQGWIANYVDPDMQAEEGNLKTLCSWLPAPCLGAIPYLEQPSPERVGEHLQGCIDALEGRAE